jgi:hypothetical protein
VSKLAENSQFINIGPIRAVVHIISALFVPIVPFVLHMIVFAYWATLATYLYTWGQPNCRRIGVPMNVVGDNQTLITNGTSCDCANVDTVKVN